MVTTELSTDLVLVPNLSEGKIEISLVIQNKKLDRAPSKFKVIVSDEVLNGFINIPAANIIGSYSYNKSNICTCGATSSSEGNNLPIKIKAGNKTTNCLCGFNGLLTINLEEKNDGYKFCIKFFLKKITDKYINLIMDTTGVTTYKNKNDLIVTEVNSSKDSGYTVTLKDNTPIAFKFTINSASDPAMNNRQYIYPEVMVNSDYRANNELHSKTDNKILDITKDWKTIAVGLYSVSQTTYDKKQDTDPVKEEKYAIRIE